MTVLTPLIFVLSQTCDTIKSTYQSTCCPGIGGAPDDVVSTANLFSTPYERYANDILSRNVSVPVTTTMDEFLVDAIYQSTLMEPRPPTLTTLTKSVGETITDVYYESIEARGMPLDVMVNNPALSNKAYVVIGGAFAVETAMALVRAGAARVYVGSRTALKQDMIKSGIVCGAERDSTSLFHSCISATDAAKIKWHDTVGTMDARDMSSIMNFMGAVLGDTGAANLTLSGVAIAHGEGRTQPTLFDPTTTTMPSTAEDMANSPTYFNNSSPNVSPHPYITYVVSFQNVVKAVAMLSPGVPINLVGSMLNYNLPSPSQINPTASAFDGIVGMEYYIAKKTTPMTQTLANLLGSPTSIVHPVGCYTGWYRQIQPLTTWYPLYTKTTDYWFSPRTTSLTYAELPIASARANALAWAESPVGQGVLGTLNVNASEYVTLLTIADAAAVDDVKFTAWPVPSKKIDNKWHINGWLNGIAFFVFIRITQFAVWSPAENPMHMVVDELITNCTDQFITEPFCRFSEEQFAIAAQILALLFGESSPNLITPVAYPVVIGTRMAHSLITQSTGTFIQTGIIDVAKTDMPFQPTHYLDKRNHQSLADYSVDLMTERVGDGRRVVESMTLA